MHFRIWFLVLSLTLLTSCVPTSRNTPKPCNIPEHFFPTDFILPSQWKPWHRWEVTSRDFLDPSLDIQVMDSDSLNGLSRIVYTVNRFPSIEVAQESFDHTRAGFGVTKDLVVPQYSDETLTFIDTDDTYWVQTRYGKDILSVYYDSFPPDKTNVELLRNFLQTIYMQIEQGSSCQ